MKSKSFILRASAMVAAGATMALMGCAGPGHSIDPDAQKRAASTQSSRPAPEDFPAVESAKWKEGAFPSLEALRAMRTGMGKDQVRQLLSWPHFSEGLGGVPTWNYIFHFRTGSGPEYITCQYMVRFNDDVLTSGMYWNKPECAQRMDPPAAKPTPVAAIAAPQRKVTLGVDGLFRFDGGSPADLLPQGRGKLEALASEINRDGRSLDSIVVTGHTDRLGTGSYNQALSMARASTVRDVLVQNGIDASLIRVTGKGEAEPRVRCEQKKRDELIACLAPNRRFEIEVDGGR